MRTSAKLDLLQRATGDDTESSTYNRLRPLSFEQKSYFLIAQTSCAIDGMFE
jgi:hypothetical protein